MDRENVKTDLIVKTVPMHAECTECNWTGKFSDCETGWEQDGWENPEYQVAYCPKCDESSVIGYSEVETTNGTREE